jgi:hypothetical protein
MKHFISFCLLSLAFFIAGSIHSCKKDLLGSGTYNPPPPPPPPSPVDPIYSSFTEEFENFWDLTNKGWLTAEYSQADTMGTTGWTQGDFGAPGKGDSTWYGFSAFSCQYGPTEYVYSYDPAMDSNLSISSWMLSPILVVKNGDSITFYTRGDTTGIYTDRMQVLMDTLGSSNVGHDLTSVGGYTSKLFDINPTQTPGGYPTTWKKYEYTFSGLRDSSHIRIGFRHYVIHPTNARGIGIDLFKFGVQ